VPATPAPFVPVTPSALRSFADRFFIALRPLMDDLEVVSATITHGHSGESVLIENDGWHLSFELTVHLTKPHVLVILEVSRTGLAGALAGLAAGGGSSSRPIGSWSGPPGAPNAADSAAANFLADIWSDRSLCDWMRDRGKSKPEPGR
jgi:hypothetical protein